MRKPVKIALLEEGMISAQTIVQRGKSVEIVAPVRIKKLIKYFASYKFGEAMELMQPKGEAIVSSTRAGGLTEEEISELKKLASEKKIPEKLLVKESAPFVPAVLIAYIALNIVGDVIWLWV
jgi:prepilin signal peptidase PulO-like enzyme (type II secretory pathway)